MITQHFEGETVVYDQVYSLVAKENTPYLSLTSVQFTCRKCQKKANVDLSIVPAHHIAIKCATCDTPLFSISEEDFEKELKMPEA